MHSKNNFAYQALSILRSKAYSRYVDKTQVAYLIENDHIANRGLHVQLVSSFSRFLGAKLSLDLGLIEAIALGHDVGHPPFGHEGEGYLSEISLENGLGFFAHPLQSCRLFTVIEPLSLSWEILDGFLCHDGGLNSPFLLPDKHKGEGGYKKEFLEKKENPEVNLIPSTKEGCLVKLCDTISYVARDLEDALHLKLITREEIPLTALGNSEEKILDFLGEEIVQKSLNKEYIALGEGSFEALKLLREFNFKKIYNHPKLKGESEKIEKSYSILFYELLNEFTEKKEESFLYKDFLHSKTSSYRQENLPEALVIDFIAGMTDQYFLRMLRRLIVPQKILGFS